MGGRVLRALLERWDRRNQAALSGKVPESIAQRWRWDRIRDAGGGEQLRLGHVTLNDVGIQNLSRMWEWESIAYVTWEVVRNNSTLALCLNGDPYIKDLNLGFRLNLQLLRTRGTWQACLALLQDCQGFVEGHGARVYATVDPAPCMWWVGQPESRRK